jgi:hypothetical protein
MFRIRQFERLAACCLALSFWTGATVLGATEPAYEHEAPPPAKSHIQLSVPEKKWLSDELYTAEPGHYEVLIWGHAESPRAMPEKFDVEEEVRELARHHIEWYTGQAPKDTSAYEKFRRRFEATGQRVALGFPRANIVEEALKDGALPDNPSEVSQGKKPKVAPIDPHYVAASLRLIDEQFGKNENFPWVRAVHFQDEPSGEIPYYDISPQSGMPLRKEWDQEVRASFGLGKWGLPVSNWDTNVPESRLAYQRFWSKEFNNYQRTMAEALRAHHPELTIWSANFWFNKWADLLFDYGEMGGFLDAIVTDSYVTQQENDVPGRGRWNAGFVTKIVGDLAHRPVYNHIQVIEYHDATPSAEDIREYASQVLRAGGQGIVYYAVDMPKYKYVRYTDPSRWAAMMEIADQVHGLPRLKQPVHATTGIWVSQETLATTGPRVKDNDPYVAYVLFGETIGAPFRYLSDWGVERKGSPEFGDLKIIYAANTRFVPRGVREPLSRWVRNGGALVLTASDSFTRQIDGTSFASWKEALSVSGKPKIHEHFEEWPLGEGRVLLPKDSFWKMGVWDDTAQVAQVRELQTQYGGGVDEPIWRFRLPEPHHSGAISTSDTSTTGKKD